MRRLCVRSRAPARCGFVQHRTASGGPHHDRGADGFDSGRAWIRVVGPRAGRAERRPRFQPGSGYAALRPVRRPVRAAVPTRSHGHSPMASQRFADDDRTSRLNICRHNARPDCASRKASRGEHSRLRSCLKVPHIHKPKVAPGAWFRPAFGHVWPTLGQYFGRSWPMFGQFWPWSDPTRPNLVKVGKARPTSTDACRIWTVLDKLVGSSWQTIGTHGPGLAELWANFGSQRSLLGWGNLGQLRSSQGSPRVTFRGG